MPALLGSELPVRATTRHHWVTLFRPPAKALSIVLVALLFATVLSPATFGWVLALVVLTFGFLRVQTWWAERIILTGKRIIRVTGIPETTTSEASLRVDRISGARLIQTVPGKVLKYGTIELEAPGDHPEVRKLIKIVRPYEFYLELRSLVFGDGVRPDPNDVPLSGGPLSGAPLSGGPLSGGPLSGGPLSGGDVVDQITAPLPLLPPAPPQPPVPPGTRPDDPTSRWWRRP